MSMEHKAFLFDFSSFNNELRSLLESALSTGDCAQLIDFINTNMDSIKDPYEGETLDSNWETMLEFRDAHQYGDFALTKYYEPSEDIGLGLEWESIQACLLNGLGSGEAVLGKPVGPDDNLFDPGKQGSYFQDEGQVRDNLESLMRLQQSAPDSKDVLSPLVEILQKAANAGEGLYITF